ncbi:cytochrome c [Conexibacter sp. JD483]|uniref:c-type cytochrome n=1 Tax=unclassified Conexibacter TaxID=2627773 RepID=UPI00271C257C|nr:MULTISPECIES: cytochrome c [unclassified Conexibacter]MDO8188191.1 cytochrome c [Conexibacter sp. CPCC 205706]MDO8201598.1 cytochrome c [Conexibacter sp. CPCC 205762]MDR9372748.1 cytochrome c [Conexibacter sp. JD483]
MPLRPAHLPALLCACLGLAFGLAACGDDGDTKQASVQLTERPGQPEGGSTAVRPAGSGGSEAPAAGGDDAASGGGSGADAEGKAIFTQSCAGCHTLADAGATGSVGPNLDDARPSAEVVAAKVRGGGGGMPSFDGTLAPEQIEAVASYVAAAAGS